MAQKQTKAVCAHRSYPFRGILVCGLIGVLLSPVLTMAQASPPNGAPQRNDQNELLQSEEALTTCTTDLAQCTDTLTLCRGQCGNGVAEFQEQCDGQDRRSQSCASLTNGDRPYGMLACTPECRWDASGCTVQRFVDNGNGTVTDLRTGLTWEQKTEEPLARFRRRGQVPRFEGGDPCGGMLHGVNGVCTWFATMNVWIARLNAERFAGYTDWRVPTVQELLTIVDYKRAYPAIDPLFTLAKDDGYWSATEVVFSMDHAWGVDYTTGRVFFAQKTLTGHVRAVRGGF